MNIEDIIIPPKKIETQSWQLGHIITNEIPENGIVLLFVSDFRGAERSAEILDFSKFRKSFYTLSKLDFETPICDLGDLVSGKTSEDTHYILQEVLSACHYKNAIPVVLGGSNDLSYSLFSALNFHHKNINYTQVSSTVSLDNSGKEITEKNYLSKIFGTKNFLINNFHLIGYQKYLNELDSVKMIAQVDFDIIRLSEMMNSTEKTEPFFRKADLVTFNCDSVESFGEAFSVHPQVNGLNKREVCAYMKEIGMSEKLKSVGVFNFNFESESLMNHQLMSQMIWYLLEGINIRKTHPSEKEFETFWVMIDDDEYAFKRDIFTDLWYFGNDENIDKCVPCSKKDFEDAKRGYMNLRLLKGL